VEEAVRRVCGELRLELPTQFLPGRVHMEHVHTGEGMDRDEIP